jgi:hypothetical protein
VAAAAAAAAAAAVAAVVVALLVLTVAMAVWLRVAVWLAGGEGGVHDVTRVKGTAKAKLIAEAILRGHLPCLMCRVACSLARWCGCGVGLGRCT